MNIDEKLLTSHELARVLKVSRQTVMRHYHAGIIPGTRVGRFLRFDYDAVMAALKGGGK
jgi:excisionase family DNA binding protein